MCVCVFALTGNFPTRTTAQKEKTLRLKLQNKEKGKPGSSGTGRKTEALLAEKEDKTNSSNRIFLPPPAVANELRMNWKHMSRCGKQTNHFSNFPPRETK